MLDVSTVFPILKIISMRNIDKVTSKLEKKCIYNQKLSTKLFFFEKKDKTKDFAAVFLQSSEIKCACYATCGTDIFTTL